MSGGLAIFLKHSLWGGGGGGGVGGGGATSTPHHVFVLYLAYCC